jgi:hypothetical protein
MKDELGRAVPPDAGREDLLPPSSRCRHFVDVDADVSAILDAEIGRQAQGLRGPLPTVRFSRKQMLRALLLQAVRCECGGRGDVTGPPVSLTPTVPRRRRVVDLDTFAIGLLDQQILNYGNEKGAAVVVRRSQMLRFLVLRAGWCRCG